MTRRPPPARRKPGPKPDVLKDCPAPAPWRDADGREWWPRFGHGHAPAPDGLPWWLHFLNQAVHNLQVAAMGDHSDPGAWTRHMFNVTGHEGIEVLVIARYGDRWLPYLDTEQITAASARSGSGLTAYRGLEGQPQNVTYCDWGIIGLSGTHAEMETLLRAPGSPRLTWFPPFAPLDPLLYPKPCCPDTADTKRRALTLVAAFREHLAPLGLVHKRPARKEWLSCAITFIATHPAATATEVAAHVGMDRSTISKAGLIARARRQAKGQRENLARGE